MYSNYYQRIHITRTVLSN